MVRVTLPGTLPETIATAVGDVAPGAHLLTTVDEVAHKFGAHIDGEVDRVDLITPARLHGSRFAAVSVYLGYRAGRGDLPSFYVLEAGMATGEPKVLFFAPELDHRIVSQSGYRPTPFSDANHVYNCNACTSQPACGWCEQPQAGQAACQPDIGTPTACIAGFRRSPNECAAPATAPPGAVE